MFTLFEIFLGLGILLFVLSFFFKEVNIIMLAFSGIVFLLLSSGLFLNAINIEIGTEDVYNYDTGYSPPLLESIDSTPIYYEGKFKTALGIIFAGLGIFLLALIVDDQRRIKNGNAYR